MVVSSFGVPHFPDPEAFFRDSLRVLGPAGRFAFTVWATPERAKGFEIVFAAVKRHGTLQVGLPQAPDFFLYADPETSRASLTAAGFAAVATTLLPQTWQLATADDLFHSVVHGTVRTAAVLKRQSPDALERIRASVREAMEAYAEGGVYRLPMPAVLVTATKPAEV